MPDSPSHIEAIGLLHPGEMGAAVATCLVDAGFQVYWLAEGRSGLTRERAERAGLRSLLNLPQLCEKADLMLSICPPLAASDVAGEVVAQGFSGIYLDANAISPGEVQRLGELMSAAEIQFVDGGIIGPAGNPSKVTLYLSGEGADALAPTLACPPVTVRSIGGDIGHASALKMCYAAVTKGYSALRLASIMVAERLGVDEVLLDRWTEEGKPALDTVQLQAKAWRFIAEMQAIADTFEGVDVTPDFHRAAKAIYTELADSDIKP